MEHLLNDGENVIAVEDFKLLAIEFHFGAAILGDQHAVTFLDFDGNALAVVVQFARPDSAKEKPMESVVVALGTGKTDDSGKKVPFEVKKGDRILVSKYGGTEIKLDGKEYKILNSDDVLAVID